MRRADQDGCSTGCGAIIITLLLIAFGPAILEIVGWILLAILLFIGALLGALMNALHHLF